MPTRYGQFCPVAKASEVLGERWTILIIREFLSGATRYRDLQRGLAAMSPTLLTKRLNQLTACGLIERRPATGRAHAEYHLTAAGRELQPVVDGLGKWGMRWARGEMRAEDLDVQALMLDVCRRLDDAALPSRPAVIAFSFPRLAKFNRWWVVADPGRPAELCDYPPGRPTHLHLQTDLRTMVEIWIGDTPLAAAVRDGRARLEGEPAFTRTVATWLPLGRLAHIKRAAVQLRHR
ncbi:MAG TPA: helix-turn-helix domain-containing protein [Lacunisphaera sp.]|nr:helix-turn-helix domain-containing protein [Lacunisphaera sp.]